MTSYDAYKLFVSRGFTKEMSAEAAGYELPDVEAENKRVGAGKKAEAEEEGKDDK